MGAGVLDRCVLWRARVRPGRLRSSGVNCEAKANSFPYRTPSSERQRRIIDMIVVAGTVALYDLLAEICGGAHSRRRCLSAVRRKSSHGSFSATKDALGSEFCTS